MPLKDPEKRKAYAKASLPELTKESRKSKETGTTQRRYSMKQSKSGCIWITETPEGHEIQNRLNWLEELADS